MKSSIFTLLIILVASSAFALQTSEGGIIVMGTGDNTMNVGLSSEVRAAYVNDGSGDDSAQWYAIGAYHQGGTRVYGTAQDITNLYYQDRTPGTAFDWSGMPSDPESSNEWKGDGDSGWKQL